MFDFFANDPYDDLADALADLRGDYDAIALLPYDDGTYWMKPANFDKALIGGQGGYETDDGDKIVLDGEGKPVREFLGVNIVSALDPTEHTGAVDHVKAHIAHKQDIGEWLKVDRRGNIIDVGEALVQADDSDVDVGVEGSMVEERAGELVAENPELQEQMAYDRALTELETQGDVTKIMDIAPPSEVSVAADGGIKVEEATHIAVDMSKGADLMPKTTSTTELQTALDKARMEEHEPRSLQRDLVFLTAGAVVAIVFGGMMVGMNAVV